MFSIVWLRSYRLIILTDNTKIFPLLQKEQEQYHFQQIMIVNYFRRMR
jgi:hypothetical protein